VERKKSRLKAEKKTGWPGWTGFRGKTVWDWLQLLIVPLVLAGVGLWFTMNQDARQQQIEDQRAQDAALQAYLDQMSELILQRNLLESEWADPTHTLAQARTSTAILRLDSEHNESVTRFLTDTGLSGYWEWPRSGEAPVSLLIGIDLQNAQLSNADLRGADLSDANLRDADLSNANLPEAYLSRADLRDTDLSGAYLSGAELSDANLNGADLEGADLGQATLEGADMNYANLSGAYLTLTHLRQADLKQADLSGADLSGADLYDPNWVKASLSGADLSGANLSDAEVTRQQLDQAVSLTGATMPNGQKYEDWLRSKDSGEE
jgi:uncharacterized protein YjbI with pentapeptide repeats